MGLFFMMSMFVVAMALDTYTDRQRGAEDILMESGVELETEDYEWDELDEDNGIYRTALTSYAPIYCQLPTHNDKFTTIRISDKQRLGLVRRYAPRKALVCHNYNLT